MKIYFNELSIYPKVASENESHKKMGSFCNLIKEAFSHGFNKVVFPSNILNSYLCENFTINDWLNVANPTLRNFFFSIYSRPFLDEGNNDFEGFFVNINPRIDDCEIENIENESAYGLALSDYYGSLCISSQHHVFWDNSIIKISGVKPQSIECKNFSCSKSLNTHIDFIKSLLPPNLSNSNIKIEDKKITLSGDHHGNKELMDFSKKLIQSKYVNEVIHSIPYSPYARKIIKRIYPDGKIDIVLINTDAKYGIRIQTTGKDFYETRLIAKLLEKEYL